MPDRSSSAPRSLPRVIAAIFLAVALTGCDTVEGIINPQPPHGRVVAFEVLPAAATVRAGEALQLVARAEYEDGWTAEVAPRWTATAGLSVNERGLVTVTEPIGRGWVYAHFGTSAASSIIEAIPGCAEPVEGQVAHVAITGIQIIQAVDLGPRGLPVAAGKDLLVRAYVEAAEGDGLASLPLYATVDVSRDGDVIGSATSQIGCGEIVNDPDVLVSTLNTFVPDELLGDGLGIAVTLHLAPGVAATPTSVLRYPQAGWVELDFFAPPPFAITFVPVVVDGVETVFDSGAAAVAALRPREIWPLDEVAVDVREPYTFSGAADAEGADRAFLRELLELRLLEGAASYYHGVLPPEAPEHWSSGVGYLGLPVAYSTQYETGRLSGNLVAHELGHNFDRPHAPCGGAGNPDPEYPYPDAAIGVHGYGPWTDSLDDMRLYPPTTNDLMSYCWPQWISDYNFELVAEFRAQEAATAAAVQSSAATAALLVSGAIDGSGDVSLRPLFVHDTVPSPPAPGEWRFELVAADGAALLSVPFRAYEVADEGPRAALHFAFTLPVSAEALAAAASARVVAADGRVRAELTDALAAAAGSDSTARARRTSGTRVAVEWDAATYQAAIFIDPGTGRVVGRDASGRAVLHYAGSSLELLLSSGVHSVRQLLNVR